MPLSLQKLFEKLQYSIPMVSRPSSTVLSRLDYTAKDVNCVCFRAMTQITLATGIRFHIVNITQIIRTEEAWHFSMFVTDQDNSSLLIELVLETDTEGTIQFIDIPALKKYDHFGSVRSFDIADLSSFGQNYEYTSSLQRLQEAYRDGVSLAQTLSTGDVISYK